MVWHEGETCGDYDERIASAQKGEKEDREGREDQVAKQRLEDQASMEMVETTSKVCPGSECLWRIEKRDGCDHMICEFFLFSFIVSCDYSSYSRWR